MKREMFIPNETKIILGLDLGLDLAGEIRMHRSEDRFAKHTQTTFAFMALQFAFHDLQTNYTDCCTCIAQ